MQAVVQKLWIITALTILGLSVINFVAPMQKISAAPCEPDQSILGIPTWYKYLESNTDSTGKCSPSISEAADALPIGLAVLEGAIRLAGLVAVVMIFVSAFKFITAQGNGEAAKDARMTAINAVIGLVIVILATSVISFIGHRLK